ncbi:MAG: biotin carboxylase N-terminal domain-containing protein [Nocardioides sp.]|uniref:ATP-binding protein n=1 Tax=Nocardioides sp. TaxID=35761 RepID=UPI0039E25ADE
MTTEPHPAPHTLVIANRGEIARRVGAAVEDWPGWRTVAIHTAEEPDAPHVRAADEARLVPSYLDIDAIVAAAVDAGATLVHPGYGFLSERAAFARAVAEAGLTLVGPSADVIELMGDKAAARRVAERAGVPVVPAYDVAADPDDLDYPVMVKAVAGGGGKGMRIVRSTAELPAALAAAGREAASAFGDDRLLIEKYVERGRHIEVQVFGDTHGNVVHLGERDCSVQRRHQKVVEEAPAPTITDDQRRIVTEAAVALARAVGYVNAGTVEFLLDTASGAAYFLEMNTRLQVEHPVTELVTGLNLVEWQLRVATGEPLPLGQDEIHPRGHAIEARIYAEDPYAGFLPQAGTATYVAWPSEPSRRYAKHVDDDAIRVDHALESAQEVSAQFDPMLAKVITSGADREEARHSLLRALDDTVIAGLTTNTGFVRALVASQDFRDATIDTAWLDRGDGADLLEADQHAAGRAVAAAVEAAEARDAGSGPFAADGWRLGAQPAAMHIQLDRSVEVTGDPRSAARSSTYAAGDAEATDTGATDTGATVDGVPVRLADDAGWSAYDPADRDHAEVDLRWGDEHLSARIWERRGGVEVVCRGQRSTFAHEDAFADHRTDQGDGTVLAPMPGTVLAVQVATGDHVETGQVLGIMEAMKMELGLTAPFGGVVESVAAVAGERVTLGDALFSVAADSAEEGE